MDFEKKEKNKDKEAEQEFYDKGCSFGCGYMLSSILGGVVAAIYISNGHSGFIKWLILIIGFSAFVCASMVFNKCSETDKKKIRRWSSTTLFFVGMITWFVGAVFLWALITYA